MASEAQSEEEQKQQQAEWYRLPADEVLDRLDAAEDGLSEDEARTRLEKYGKNTVREQKKISPWQVLLNQFLSPLIYVLLGALVVTIAIQKWSDAIVIGAVLVINATIGFIQEYRAENAVQSLMQMVAPRASVRRGGQEQDVERESLVPGDIVLLSEGGVVPADIRLLAAKRLQINEAPLTGESVPASKTSEALESGKGEEVMPADQKNMAFMGTNISAGRGRGVVVATGHTTQIGSIAEQVQSAGETQTPLQKRMDRLAKWIAAFILILCGVAFGAGLLIGKTVEEMFLLAVALAVAAMPAGLPVVMTVTLAIGVRRMAKRNAIIRHLPAVETLGSTTTILSDKTGTLTQNRMTVQRIAAGGDFYDVTGEAFSKVGEIQREGDYIEPEENSPLWYCLLTGMLNNEAEWKEDSGPDHRGEEERTPDQESGDQQEEESEEDESPVKGDPMQAALLLAAMKAGLDREELRERFPQVDDVPFETERKFSATIHEDTGNGGGKLVLVKGAPEVIAAMSNQMMTASGETEELREEDIDRQNRQLARSGLRVLAMAIGRGDEAAESIQSDAPEGFTLVGLQGMKDPPRPEAVDAVDNCHEAGIRVMMITGDHAETAAAIARQVHLDQPEQWQEVRRSITRTEGEDQKEEPAPKTVQVDVVTAESTDSVRRVVVDTDASEAGKVRTVVRVRPEEEEQPEEPEEREEQRSNAESENDGKPGGESFDEGDLPEVCSGQRVADAEDSELDSIIESTSVYARVKPDQKLRIVRRLRENGRIVAVTGDGVNDAPALKEADLGAAMGKTGTDVAREASDMVITDDNFASVYSAVEEGRTSFRNIRMATFFLLSTGAADVLVILSALAMRWPLPLLPAQLLWCNVVTNGIQDVALGFEPGEKALYKRPPRPPKEGILDRNLIERLVVVGLWLAAGVIGIFYWKHSGGATLTETRTAALTTLVLFQMVHVFNCRSQDLSLFKKNLFSNKVLFIGVVVSLIVHVGALYVPWTQELLSIQPLDLITWAVIVPVAFSAIIVNELHKLLRGRRS